MQVSSVYCFVSLKTLQKEEVAVKYKLNVPSQVMEAVTVTLAGNQLAELLELTQCNNLGNLEFYIDVEFQKTDGSMFITNIPLSQQVLNFSSSQLRNREIKHHIRLHS